MTSYMPENIIVRYLWEQFKNRAPMLYNSYPKTSGGEDIIPFFPAGVGNIPPEIIEDGLPYFIFDKFTKVRTGKYKYFYPIKSDQMRLTVFGGSLPHYGSYSQQGDYEFASTQGYLFDRYGYTIKMTSLITAILDREDAAAQDINEFATTLPGYTDSDPVLKYYFQCINVFQSGYAESQQDVANLMEYRPSRDLIIKYDYHHRQYNESPSMNMQ